MITHIQKNTHILTLRSGSEVGEGGGVGPGRYVDHGEVLREVPPSLLRPGLLLLGTDGEHQTRL